MGQDIRYKEMGLITYEIKVSSIQISTINKEESGGMVRSIEEKGGKIKMKIEGRDM